MYLKNLIVTILLLIAVVHHGQPVPDMPEEIHVFSNDSSLSSDGEWQAKLPQIVSGLKTLHAIAAFHVDGDRVDTKLRLPLTLSPKEVAAHLIRYYSMIGSQQGRQNERVMVYPYFSDIRLTPYVFCRYKEDGMFFVMFRRWETIPVPEEPSLIEKKIYNAVLNSSFASSETFGQIPPLIYERVAKRYELSALQVQEIYRRVFHWHMR